MELSLAQLRGEMHAALKGRVGLLESAQVQAYVRCRSSLEVGRALARLGQRDAAVASLMEGLKVVPALEQPAVVLEVLTECGRALVPLDRGLAGRTLEQADQLARAIGSAKALEDVAASRALLRQGTSEEAPALLVSVVIPCFRQAGLLSEAVLSVVDQTFAGWEIVIVNDGSPDDTSAVARSLAARHPDRRIRLIEKPNGGLSSARNAGVRAAAGKYILPLDADDKIESTMLAELVPLLEARPELGFVYGHIRHFGDRTDEYPLPDFDRDTLVLKDNIVCVCSLFRKPAWEQVGGYNEAM
ncbi:MAG: glycosyltransferase family 2 protein, partial [Verrucomicrobia bacterium]|nr:glycosyltransferase family 2 protein [Verrucomicrobiota bacterium]